MFDTFDLVVGTSNDYSITGKGSFNVVLNYTEPIDGDMNVACIYQENSYSDTIPSPLYLANINTTTEEFDVRERDFRKIESLQGILNGYYSKIKDKIQSGIFEPINTVVDDESGVFRTQTVLYTNGCLYATMIRGRVFIGLVAFDGGHKRFFTLEQGVLACLDAGTLLENHDIYLIEDSTMFGGTFGALDKQYIKTAIRCAKKYGLCPKVNSTEDIVVPDSTNTVTINMETGTVISSSMPRFVKPKSTCEFCNKELSAYGGYTATDDDKDYRLCRSCYNKYRRLGHWSRLEPIFSNNDYRNIDLHAGFELEIDGGRGYLATIKDILDTMGDRVYCERDGSLGEAGIEIISMPFNYDEYTNAPLKELFDKCKQHGYTSHKVGTCGLHFHFDRAFVDQATADRLQWFVTNYYDTIITNISRRPKNNVSRWAYKNNFVSDKLAEKDVNKRITKLKTEYIEHDHHECFNVQNDNTVEFRFFRGTLNYDTFMMSYKTLYQLCHIAKGLKDEDAFDIGKWEEKMTPDVLEFIENKGVGIKFDMKYPRVKGKGRPVCVVKSSGELD